MIHCTFFSSSQTVFFKLYTLQGVGMATFIVLRAGMVTAFNGGYKEPGMSAQATKNNDVHMGTNKNDVRYP